MIAKHDGQKVQPYVQILVGGIFLDLGLKDLL